MQHIWTVRKGNLQLQNDRGCHQCNTSCQSACKTSCTVSNLDCKQVDEKLEA